MRETRADAGRQSAAHTAKGENNVEWSPASIVRKTQFPRPRVQLLRIVAAFLPGGDRGLHRGFDGRLRELEGRPEVE